MAQIDLDPADRIPNRDFVVRYRLAGSAARPVVLAGRDAALDGHLLLMIQPKARPVRADISPREYVFVVDTSGSMSGTPLEQIKQAMHSCLGSMQPQDRFQVVQFAGDASALAPAPLPPTEDNLQDIGDPTFDGRVLQEIRSVRARLPGLEMDRELTPGTDGSHALEFRAPDRPGRYPVTVVVRDPARNKVRRTLWLVVD